MEEFNWSKNLARVKAGFKGGDQFSVGPQTKLTFKDRPEESKRMFEMDGQRIMPASPTKPWNERRSK